MAVFELQGPDGKVYEVDAPDPQSALAAFRQMPAPTQRYDEKAAKDRMYEGRARNMREKSPTLTRIRDTASRLVEGTPVGSWFDEAMAGAGSLVYGQPYDEMKGTLDADRRIRDEESTVVGKLPVIGDVTAGGLTKLAGGIATAPLAPVANVFKGGTLVPRVANTAISGGGYGAAYGAGEGNTLGERGGNALIGLGVGSVIGGAAPLVGEAVGNTVSALRNRSGQLPQGVQGYGRPAIDRMNEAIDMDGLTLSGYYDRSRQLGREAMLADMGDGGLTTVTEGLAQQPGPARATIKGALDARAAGATDRIKGDARAVLGQPTNVNLAVEANRKQVNALAKPYYDAFYATEIPVDQELVSILQAVPGEVWPRVQRLMQAERLNVDQVANNGRGIDLIKRALDDQAMAAGRGTNEHRIISGLAKQLRDHVDSLISPTNPADSAWAKARGIAEEGYGVREAVEQGQNVFSRGLDPLETDALLAQMNQVEQAAFRTGAASDLRNKMGRAATTFRDNGDASARRALNSEFARENVELIAGQKGADRLLGRIDAENTFADTRNTVLSNSATARRQAARDMIPRQYNAAAMKELRGTSLTGYASEIAGRVLNLVTAGALNERNGRIAREMAEMLVAQGAKRDEIVRGLMAVARSKEVTRQNRNAVAAIARDVARSTSQPAIAAGSKGE